MTIQVEAIRAWATEQKEKNWSDKVSMGVEAGAGCGKTTLIVGLQPLLPRDTLFMAFNKSIASELKARMPMAICQTFHAKCLGVLKARLPKKACEVVDYKYERLAKNRYALNSETAKYVSKLIDLFQLQVEGVHTPINEWNVPFFGRVIGDEGVLLDDTDVSCSYEDALEMAMFVLADELNKPTGLTFNDMLFFTAFYAIDKRWSLKDHKLVVIDEAQDVSPIRLELVRMFSDRHIFVGDPRQAIYKFAGAMGSAMANMQAATQAIMMPLSVTWRCDKAIIQEASSVVGDYLQPRPDAGDGVIGNVSYNSLFSSDLGRETMIVCRTNAPLLVLALGLLRRQIPVRLLSDYPSRLLALVEKLSKGVKGMASLEEAVQEHFEIKIAAVKSKGLIARLCDERDSIFEICKISHDVKDVLSKFKLLLTADFGVTLCTGHKSKGLEAERVMLLRPDLMPAPWVDPENEEDMQQEANLKYVAITRAKHSFYYIEGGV